MQLNSWSVRRTAQSAEFDWILSTGNNVTVLDADKIDIVATRPNERTVLLVIADHLGWDSPDEHCRALERKLEGYLAFVESGQIQRISSPPIPEHPRVVVVVSLMHPAPPTVDEFFAKAAAFLSKRGLALEVEHGGARTSWSAT